jgi:hypothetical protein
LVLVLLLLFPRDHRGALGQFFEINFERDRFICRRQRRRRRRRNILLVFSRRRRRNRRKRLVAHFYSVDFSITLVSSFPAKRLNFFFLSEYSSLALAL